MYFKIYNSGHKKGAENNRKDLFAKYAYSKVHVLFDIEMGQKGISLNLKLRSLMYITIK